MVAVPLATLVTLLPATVKPPLAFTIPLAVISPLAVMLSKLPSSAIACILNPDAAIPAHIAVNRNNFAPELVASDATEFELTEL